LNKIFHIGSTFKAFEEGDDLHIAGMASTNGTDRVGDVIETEAWTKGGLQNYLNNPVILFNHDYNQPIGRAITLGTNDNGLQLKAKIAKSAGHVGELIKEGVLGAFSVGFRVKDAEYMTETDGYKIKDAELLEVSVVTVPANQAATFSLAKSFNSESEYEEFKKSFKTEDSVEEKHVLNVRETEDKVLVEFEKHSETESMPKDSSRVEAQEKTMSDIDIDAIVAAAVEKTATAMAMKEAERKAEEQTRLEAEQKAAEEAETQKAEQEAQIVTAVTSGAEKLMADVEAKLAEKDANHAEIIGSLQNELKEKAAEIEKIQQSKRVFADRSDKSAVSAEDMVNAHILGVVTSKGLEGTRFGRSILEKVNTNAGVTVPTSTTADFESTVSTAIERDIELELVLDPLFRKIQMSAASMVIPTMPDAGYAEWKDNNATGGASGAFPEGNLEDRANGGSPYTGGPIGMGSTVITAERLISRSYLANETEEDSIMPILPLIREAMVRSHARAIEHSLLYAGHADAVNTGGQKGLVQQAVEAEAAVTGSGVLDTDDTSPFDYTATAAQLLNMRQAMGKYGRRPEDVRYIISLDAYYDLLDDMDFQKANELGEVGTRTTGQIGSVYGSPVVVCDEFQGGKVAGKFWGLAVNTRNFVVPVLRGVTVESDYEVANQHRVLVATQRRGFDNLFKTGLYASAGQVVAHKW
jgi:HK97 family phage prohead protease